DDFDAGQIVAREGDAEINRKPGLLARRAKAVDRQIHADLADPAERRKNQFLLRGRQPALRVRSKGNTSPAAMASRSPRPVRSISRPESSMVSKRPAATRPESRTRTGSPTPAACASHAARIAAKPEPRRHC